jgi:hypothetical protein
MIDASDKNIEDNMTMSVKIVMIIYPISFLDNLTFKKRKMRKTLSLMKRKSGGNPGIPAT